MFRSHATAIQTESKAAEPRAKVTALLVLLLLCAAALVIFAMLRLSGARDDAARSAGDLAICRADLADLARWRARRTTAAPLSAADPELNRRLSAASVAAGISGELASIEPGQPNRVRDSDYTETPVYVRLEAVTLRQLVTFLGALTASDAAVRPKSIELATPAAPPSGSASAAGELWTTDLTLAYLTYAPRGRESR
jgi:hypothetical protein